MQSSVNNFNNGQKPALDTERRAHIFRILNEFSIDQLASFLLNHHPSSPEPARLRYLPRNHLLHQALIFMDTHYTKELEQVLYAISQQRPALDPHHANQQTPSTAFNEPQLSIYDQQTLPFVPQTNYRFASPSSMMPPTRSLLPTSTALPSTSNHYTFTQALPAASQRPIFNTFVPTFQQASHQQSTLTHSILPSSASPIIPRNQPANPPPLFSTNLCTQPKSILPSQPTPPSVPSKKIVHKILPFYRPINCVYNRHQAFQYDVYRKHYVCRDGFVLSLDASNKLALSFDYDPQDNVYRTSKRLLLRLARLDQASLPDGTYDDNLPPNLVVTVNGQNVTSLPTPKPSSREQCDLIRVGREIDITSYCMFNPGLRNEFNIVWSLSLDNKNLRAQYATAQYAVHIFLADHYTVDELYEQIQRKPVKFYCVDLMKLLARANAHDHEEDLVVSDQILKLICAIDQRRLTTPVRALSCQHLQCFDLRNYLVLNQKSGKWLCPVCNKPAAFSDLQIDSFTESILNAIDDERITDITVDSDLHWTPVEPLVHKDEEASLKSRGSLVSSPSDCIFLDDDEQ